MKKNKEAFIEKLIQATNKSKEECLIINDILEKHPIIGHNNKQKIITDFINTLNLSKAEANHLYNTTMQLIITGLISK